MSSQFDKFIDYVKRGNYQNVEMMIENNIVDPSENDNIALIIATKEGRDKVVEILLLDPRVNPSSQQNKAFKNATSSMSYNAAIVKLLLNDERLVIDDEEIKIAKSGSFSKYILSDLENYGKYKNIDLNQYDFDKFMNEIKNNNIILTKMLLKHGKIDPSQKNNIAVKEAVKLGHTTIILYLLRDERVGNTVNYDELIDNIKITEYNKNKYLNWIISSSKEKNEKRKQKEKEEYIERIRTGKASPKEFKSVRKIVKPSELLELFEFDDSNKRDILIFNGSIKREFDFIPNITIISKNISIIEKKEYVPLTCDMELFGWENIEKFIEHLINIATLEIFPLFTVYLGKMFGNDLTIFTAKSETQEKIIDFSKWLNSSVMNTNNSRTDIDRIFNFPNVFNHSDGLRNALKKQKLQSDRFYFPILITETVVEKKYYYKCNYCKSISIPKTKYAIIDCVELFSNGIPHYTYIFVDHEKKEVEFYDPDIGRNPKELILFMNKTLKHIFKYYKVNKFWELKTIQKIETFEKDKEGFCVVWGHMMMHLKLLNVKMPINILQDLFIQEAYNKKISLYELVLNYTYYMRRVIPYYDMDKFVKMRDLLM